MKKILYGAVFFLALTISINFIPQKVFSAGDEIPEGSAPIYGGAPVYGGGVIIPSKGEVLIDKMVQNPATETFVDHLGPTDPKYHPTQIVTFKIKIQNPGGDKLDEIIVIDTLPEYVDFSSGLGDYDQDSRQLRFTVNDFNPGDSREVEIKGRVVHQAVLPEDKNVVCTVNKVEAQANDRVDRDDSQFCIEKEMVVPEVPSAGPANGLLVLSGFLTTLTTGIYLRKKTNKN